MESAESPVLTIDLQPREYLLAVQAANQRLLKPGRGWVVFISALAVGVIFGLLMSEWGQALTRSTFGLPLLVFGPIAALWLLQLAQRRALYQRLVATQPASYTLRLAEDGIHTESERGQSCLLWSALESIDTHPQGLHLHFRGFQVLWVPARLFADSDAYQAFVAALQDYSGRTVVARIAEPECAPNLHPLAAWLGNLGAGFGFLALRPMAGRLHASVGQFIALVLTALALDLLSGWLRISGPALFNPTALPASLLLSSTLLVAAWAAARADGLPDTSPRVLRGAVALIATWTALSLIATALIALGLMRDDTADVAGVLILFAMLLWTFAAMTVALCRSLEMLPEARVGAGLAVIGLFVAPLFLIASDAELWVKDYRRSDESAALRQRWEAPAQEAVIYAQPALLAEALARLQPGTPGVPEVFLLAVAGHGSQDVFKREVEAVQAQFAEHFGTATRSVALINNPETVESAPFASVTALRRTLQAIGERMNKDEDVLFLFMTSHGSAEHEFDLSLYPYKFQELTPPVLKAAIEEAGIRYRVVVVSACYSGGFIPALKSPEALVITAARADRNSHGCSHEADRTFFGRAYFDEALQETRSFRRAYDAAIIKIAEREKAEEYTPSEPQIAEGASIRAVLDQLETYWKRKGSAGES